MYIGNQGCICLKYMRYMVIDETAFIYLKIERRIAGGMGNRSNRIRNNRIRNNRIKKQWNENCFGKCAVSCLLYADGMFLMNRF